MNSKRRKIKNNTRSN